MLLIVGGKSDPNVVQIVTVAEQLGKPLIFWDTDDPQSHRISWQLDSPEITLGDSEILPTGVFLRWNVFGGDADRNLAIFHTVQAYQLSHPELGMLNRHSISDANNKALNLKLARKLGFETPRTMVTCDPSRSASSLDGESHITKPLGGGAHARDLNSAMQDPNWVEYAGPQIVQERLRGTNLRIFVVGTELFCFEIRSRFLDYRDDHHAEVLPIKDPQDLVRPALSLAKERRFDFCAIDLRCDTDQIEPKFLEINSFPMFSAFDSATNNKISKAIILLLTQ